MATRISIDVDLTIVDENETLLPGVVEGLNALKDKGFMLTLWSHGGEDRARMIARKHNLCCFFDGYATKPDLIVDDDPEVLPPVVAYLDLVDVLVGRAHKRKSVLAALQSAHHRQ